MKIKFKLYATLQHLLPPEAVDNAVELEVTDEISLHEVIEKFHVPRKSVHLVLVNGVYIGGEDRDAPGLLKEGDVLAVWPPVAGG